MTFAVTASYAAAVWVGVSLLASLAWVLYGNSESLLSLGLHVEGQCSRHRPTPRPLRGPDQNDHAVDDRSRSRPALVDIKPGSNA